MNLGSFYWPAIKCGFPLKADTSGHCFQFENWPTGYLSMWKTDPDHISTLGFDHNSDYHLNYSMFEFDHTLDPFISKTSQYYNILSINVKLLMTRVLFTTGALLVLFGQRIAVTSAFIFAVYCTVYRNYGKWYSSHMNAWHQFANNTNTKCFHWVL